MTSTPLPSRIELRSGRCWVLARSAWCRWRSGHAKPVSGSMNEHRDGGFEAVLAFAQLTAVRRTAEGAGRGECHIGQHPHLEVARDELYPEPGSFRGGAQAVTLDAGREVVASGCISLVMEPQGNEPSLELSHSAGESAAGTGLLVPEPLAALEGLGALGGTALEEIGGEGPSRVAATPMRAVRRAFTPIVDHVPLTMAMASRSTRATRLLQARLHAAGTPSPLATT